MLLKRIVIIGALTFTSFAAVAGKNSAADIDDQLDTVEKYGRYVGYMSECAASASLQNQFSSDIVASFVSLFGANARVAISRAAVEGRKAGDRDVTTAQETCPERLFAAGKLWQSIGLVNATDTKNPAKLPARFAERIEAKTDLTSRIGQEVHPALNSCTDATTAEILKEDLRALQAKHIWGPEVSKKAASDSLYGRDAIYTGDYPDRKVVKSKCPDTLVFAGAHFKLLEQAYGADDATPEARYVLRRALGIR